MGLSVILSQPSKKKKKLQSTKVLGKEQRFSEGQGSQAISEW
jgi:hypothetical protein